MTTLRERYEGDFLEGDDLPEGVMVPAEIVEVVDPDVEKDKQGKVIDKGILRFKDKHKRLILNKTHYHVLKRMGYPDPAKWIGLTVMLQRRYLLAKHAFGEHNCSTVRIIPPDEVDVKKKWLPFMGSDRKYPPVSKNKRGEST